MPITVRIRECFTLMQLMQWYYMGISSMKCGITFSLLQAVSHIDMYWDVSGPLQIKALTHNIHENFSFDI